MKAKESRRHFLKISGSATALATLAPGSSCSSSPDLQGSDSEQQSNHRVTRKSIEDEMRRRAQSYLSQHYLVVDYYRIRRKLAYPLPVASISIPDISVPSIGNYPWATWMTWELEERVNALGWAAEWFGDEDARAAATADLTALAGWPKYRQYEGPDLSSGHAGRILWTAYTKWNWPDQELRERLVEGCRRHTQEIFPESEKVYGKIGSTADIKSMEEPYRKLHNIALIGTIAGAMTGTCARHTEVSQLNQWIQTIFRANLDFREEGFTEGVAYDGYVLDFIADWLEVVSDQHRSAILNHPALSNFLEESYMLSVPGAAEKVAEIGDVEPKEMPFHISAQAKIYRMQPDPVSGWHLGRWRIEWMRAGGLGALHSIADRLNGVAPNDGVSNAHYAVVLRHGWNRDGLAVVISCCNSPMGHLQRDNGTLVVGKAGLWLIADPGYQQYMRDPEREFTLGPTAHNYPVINGLTQSDKRPRLMELENLSEDLCRTTLDLTDCYPEEINASSVIRTVWLSGKNLVVAADRIEARKIDSLQYSWHGAPEASWWCQDGWALIHTSSADLWLTSPQFRISGDKIRRIAGSRGQLTLCVETDSSIRVVWWLFVAAEQYESFQLLNEGQSIRILEQDFSI